MPIETTAYTDTRAASRRPPAMTSHAPAPHASGRMAPAPTHYTSTFSARASRRAAAPPAWITRAENLLPATHRTLSAKISQLAEAQQHQVALAALHGDPRLKAGFRKVDTILSASIEADIRRVERAR